MRHPRTLTSQLAALLVAFSSEAFAAHEDCKGPFDGKRPSPEQIGRALQELHVWLEIPKEQRNDNDPRRQNLCGADLRGADLRGVNLAEADLTRANLGGAKLAKADLSRTFLTGADLSDADLTEANLSEALSFGTDYLGRGVSGGLWIIPIRPRMHTLQPANFTRAKLWKANLTKADLYNVSFLKAYLDEAKLTGAWLHRANLADATLRKAELSGTSLVGANFTGSDLSGSQMAGAVFVGANMVAAKFRLASRKHQLPAFEHWGSTTGLSKILIAHDPLTLAAFHSLRGEFKSNGLRDEERGITAALQRARDRRAFWFERVSKFVLFDLTADYGAAPLRPLGVLGALMLACAFLYSLALTTMWKRGAVWRVWHSDRLLDRDTQSDRERLSGIGVLRALTYSLYFSVLSAFHFGWRDLNVGNWVARIQPREYTLRPAGWVRLVSGLQSIISVYLLALAVVTYFGRPFE